MAGARPRPDSQLWACVHCRRRRRFYPVPTGLDRCPRCGGRTWRRVKPPPGPALEN